LQRPLHVGCVTVVESNTGADAVAVALADTGLPLVVPVALTVAVRAVVPAVAVAISWQVAVCPAAKDVGHPEKEYVDGATLNVAVYTMDDTDPCSGFDTLTVYVTEPGRLLGRQGAAKVSAIEPASWIWVMEIASQRHLEPVEGRASAALLQFPAALLSHDKQVEI